MAAKGLTPVWVLWPWINQPLHPSCMSGPREKRHFGNDQLKHDGIIITDLHDFIVISGVERRF